MQTKSRNRRGRLFLVALAIAACSISVAAATAKPNDTVTLNILMQATGNTPWDVVNANFAKAYPNIKINMSYVPTATLPQVLLTQLQGGNGPDLFYGSGGSGGANSLLPLARQGYVADLSGRAWSSKMPAEFDPIQKIGSKRYIFPLDIPVIAIMYNPVLLKQSGFSVPTSFAQLLTLCKAAPSKGITALTIAGAAAPNTGLTSTALATSFVYSKDPTWEAKRAAGKVTFAGSPLWTDALEHFVAMFKAGCYQPGAEGAGGNAARGLVAAGKALGEVLPTAAYPQIKAVNPDAPLAMAAFPSDKPNQQYVPVLASDSLAVNAHSGHLKEALTYIDFLARTGQSRLMARLHGGFAWNDYKKLSQGKLNAKSFTASGLSWASGLGPVLQAKHVITRLGALEWPNGEVYTVLGTDMQGLMTGQKSIPQVLSDMDAAYNKGR